MGRSKTSWRTLIFIRVERIAYYDDWHGLKILFGLFETYLRSIRILRIRKIENTQKMAESGTEDADEVFDNWCGVINDTKFDILKFR
jgi:hypothetical protein